MRIGKANLSLFYVLIVHSIYLLLLLKRKSIDCCSQAPTTFFPFSWLSKHPFFGISTKTKQKNYFKSNMTFSVDVDRFFNLLFFLSVFCHFSMNVIELFFLSTSSQLESMPPMEFNAASLTEEKNRLLMSFLFSFSIQLLKFAWIFHCFVHWRGNNELFSLVKKNTWFVCSVVNVHHCFEWLFMWKLGHSR